MFFNPDGPFPAEPVPGTALFQFIGIRGMNRPGRGGGVERRIGRRLCPLPGRGTNCWETERRRSEVVAVAPWARGQGLWRIAAGDLLRRPP